MAYPGANSVEPRITGALIRELIETVQGDLQGACWEIMKNHGIHDLHCRTWYSLEELTAVFNGISWMIDSFWFDYNIGHRKTHELFRNQGGH